MIVTHEVIEQVEGEATGRSLTWVCELIHSLGEQDPFAVLSGLWRAGHVEFTTPEREPLPHWKSLETLREREASASVFVTATLAGSSHVHG